MSVRELYLSPSVTIKTLRAAIFDLDGVLLASPHENAWREALSGISDPSLFTTEMYRAHVAGKPRLAGARAALEALGIRDAGRLAISYAERKQKWLAYLIQTGGVVAFPDALRFVQTVLSLGWPLAVASCSKNANDMMRSVRLESGQNLLEVFDVNVCGRDLPHGKPDPAIFLLAAEALRVPAGHCFVAEDAPAGLEAALAGGMSGLGVARHGDEAWLRAAGADLVVTSLDDVAIEELAEGRMCRIPE